MIYFLCKLSLKMITDWKKEILLVMMGIIISSCAVIKFTDNLTNFTRYYYDVKGTEEERIFHENRVHFTFQDSDKLDEILDKLIKQQGVKNIILKGNFQITSGYDFPVAFYYSTPILTEYDNSIGTTPDQVKDGTIVLSYGALADLGGAGNNTGNVGEINETYNENGENKIYKSFYTRNEKFPMGSKSYQVTAENFIFQENLISLNDFMALDTTGKVDDLELIYIYDNNFTRDQMIHAENVIRTIKPWNDSYKEQPKNTLEISDYIDLMSDLIIGVVLAVLNALFIYQSLLKRRIYSYSVLKLLGLKNIRLQFMILLEMIIVFSVSFIIAMILFFSYCCLTGELIYNLRYSGGYSFLLLLVIYTMLSLIMTQKLVRQHPFEIYSNNR